MRRKVRCHPGRAPGGRPSSSWSPPSDSRSSRRSSSQGAAVGAATSKSVGGIAFVPVVSIWTWGGGVVCRPRTSCERLPNVDDVLGGMLSILPVRKNQKAEQFASRPPIVCRMLNACTQRAGRHECVTCPHTPLLGHTSDVFTIWSTGETCTVGSATTVSPKLTKAATRRTIL